MFARIGPTVNARGRLGGVPERIDDTDDPRLADYRQLKDAVARRRIEGDELFVAEGPVAIDRMIASGHPVRSVLVLDRKYDRMAGLLAGVAAPIFVVDDAVLLGVAGFDLHRGAIAAGQRRTPESLADDRDDDQAGGGARGSQRPGEPRRRRPVGARPRHRGARARPDLHRPLHASHRARQHG